MSRLRLFLLVGVFALTGFAFQYSQTPKSQPAAALIHNVSLLGDKASPSVVTLKVGESVQFNTKDGKKHIMGTGSGTNEVAQEIGDTTHKHAVEGIESPMFGVGEAYRLKISKPGTIELHDHLNPLISVTVIAYEPEKK